MVSWHGTLFMELHHFWVNLRAFAYHNRTLFEVFFIFLYTLEQALLVFFTFLVRDAEELGLIIAIFALIVLTTFSIHKLLMESRIKHLENEVQLLLTEIQLLETSIKELRGAYDELYTGSLSKYLNKALAFLKLERGKND